MALEQHTGTDPDVRRAWWSLALFLPSFVGAFITGEGLLAALGHSDTETVPVGIALMAATPALVVFALPLLVVRHFGRRAVARGHDEGRPPVLVAQLGTAAFLAVNLLQLVALLVL